MSSNWKGVIASVAPTLATALGGPLGGLAASVAGRVLLGRDVSKADEIKDFVLAHQTPDTFLKLRQVETALEKELEEIDDFLKLWEKFSGTQMEQLVSGESYYIEIPPGDLALSSSAPATKRERKTPPRDKLAKIIRRLLLEEGRPMVRSALVKRLNERDVPIGGADPSRNIGTTMWRLQDEFINLKGYGYWPRDVDCPEIDYDAVLEMIIEPEEEIDFS